MEKTEVQISMRSIFAPAATGEGAEVSWDSSRCQQMETEAQGEYFRKGDVSCCIYEEQPEGWEEPYRVMLKWKDNMLERRRMGQMASKVRYEAGKCVSDRYRTPYGELQMEMETYKLDIQETPEEILLMIEYGIRQNGQKVSENRIEIRIK
ncbi:MAG: DUF1934 domain-containing protein [Acetatifactor sp.]|nr:DUF1934 domain-containing protein [Acetatifactor sp.]